MLRINWLIFVQYFADVVYKPEVLVEVLVSYNYFSLFQSLWNKFFQDKELRAMIEQDVTRTYVDL